MKTKRYLGVLLVLLVLSCQKQSNNNRTIPEAIFSPVKTVTYEQKDYTIQYPEDWFIEEDPVGEVAFFVYFNHHSTQGDIGENINLTIQPTSAATLEDYTQMSIKEIEGQGRVLLSEQKKDPNGPYQRVLCQLRLYDEDLKFIQHYRLKDNKAYVLTFTALSHNFQTLEYKAEQVMQSFRLK